MRGLDWRGRGAELRALHHGRHGAAYPRRESGDVKTRVAGRAGGFREEGVGHRPWMPCAALRAKCAHILMADAQKGRDLAADATVDFASGGRADEDKMFHERSRAGVGHTIMSRA